MATVNLIKAATRPKGSKGAARAERRAGRVPGIIYGDGKPPLPISLDYTELHQRIYAGHFLTTIHDVEVDGVKHRVIPRDFQLDAIAICRCMWTSCGSVKARPSASTSPFTS